MRYRIYRAAGVSPDKIARITIYIATAFGIGAAETIGLTPYVFGWAEHESSVPCRCCNRRSPAPG